MGCHRLDGQCGVSRPHREGVKCCCWCVHEMSMLILWRRGSLNLLFSPRWQKLGLLALVNEESRFPKGTDFTLLEKLHSRHSVSYLMRHSLSYFAALVLQMLYLMSVFCRQTLTTWSPELQIISLGSSIMPERWATDKWAAFNVRKSAHVIILTVQSVCFEQVLYDVRGILEKNRDTFRDDILNMLKDSR